MPLLRHKTLDDIPLGTYEIFEICFWEDDIVQFKNPNYEGGANGVSLFMAQRNFATFGACDEASVDEVRKLTRMDERIKNWHPLNNLNV